MKAVLYAGTSPNHCYYLCPCVRMAAVKRLLLTDYHKIVLHEAVDFVVTLRLVN